MATNGVSSENDRVQETLPFSLRIVLMKALSLDGPKQFRYVEIPEPASPGRDEVLVQVHRIGICGTDYGGYLGKMPFSVTRASLVTSWECKFLLLVKGYKTWR